MQYVSMAAVGLVVGILARFFYPGKVELGLIMSAVLGVAGAFLAGFIGNLLSKQSGGPLRPAGFVYSILGAMLVIFLARQFGLA
ncbi:GlsB/YeaQ/YmgE family stress response membrane protein [Novosphingobium sp.]|uniref:GlsB/YeaQ/YmgE family stress response membrane protein n=1 Tax=Novosphingobium sp. TaxID=1874826 RepID=UPI0035B14716